MSNIISFFIKPLKKNKRPQYCSLYIYNAFSTNLQYGSKVKISGTFLHNVKIKVKGQNNSVTICPNVMMNITRLLLRCVELTSLRPY